MSSWIKMYAAEFQGKLSASHGINAIAREVRHSVADDIYGFNPGGWKAAWREAYKDGWRVVAVAIEKLPDNSPSGMRRNLAAALHEAGGYTNEVC